ncbi:hypothetical protein [Streptomyces cahuitamycinicus]|uniref:Uncharacterized protein n=1 Tax=Streptomyces cahuitamycinicus TaxID=2070367 RepID=A0A2N8TX04_9ACTN|nr:hypothetical protein [Streptomyces cahuitamycinicus]PNG23539.1 hypothetical protein C1J00_03585 [Streptomyces cahuitamycinicus]
MELASLVVASLALFVAVGAAWYARRQADSARTMTRIEMSRHRHERTPQVELEMAPGPPLNGAFPWRLRLRLLEPSHLAHCRLTCETRRVSFEYPSSGNSVVLRQLRRWQTIGVPVRINGRSAEPLELLVQCVDENGEVWEFLQVVQMPPLSRQERQTR